MVDLVGALTLDALKGTDEAFDPRIHAARPHPGQVASAANLRALLANSPLRESHRDCGVVQDAYTLRCMPQVHGAARDAAAHARRVIEIEMNAATDNPMVFADEGELVSGGNFHAAPVALVCDLLAAAAADLASISERRVERLVNPSLSGDLPAFLVKDGGLNSGLMMIHVTAAALVSEAKANSFPASVDSIPTSAGKEDHVSMGPIAARKLARNVDLLETVLAIELLAAGQALDLRRPLASSPPLEDAAPPPARARRRSGSATARRLPRSRARARCSRNDLAPILATLGLSVRARARRRGRTEAPPPGRRSRSSPSAGSAARAAGEREQPAPAFRHAIQNEPGLGAARGEPVRDLRRRPERRGVGRRGRRGSGPRSRSRAASALRSRKPS